MIVKSNEKSALFSNDRKYRYVLWRWWNGKPFMKPYAMFIGLNPSTADETKDDPTVRRCINFAFDWGYGGLCMTNLFAFRATNPQEMMACDEPIGSNNNFWLADSYRGAGIVIAAWGTKGIYLNRGKAVCNMLDNLKCLGLTKAGYPRHPLYLSRNTKPVLFRMEDT